MRTMRNNVILSFVLAFSLCLAACQTTKPQEKGTAYQSTNVKVSLMNTTDINFVDAELMPLSNERVFDHNSVILTGVVSNVRQATVEYEYMDQEVVDHVTLFDLDVSQVLTSRSDRFSKPTKVSVGTLYHPQYFWRSAPILKEGVSYLIFCQVTSDLNDDVLELSELADLWCSDPRLIIEKMDDYYLLVTEFLAKSPHAHSLKQMTEVFPDIEFYLSRLNVDHAEPMSSTAAKSKLEELFTISSMPKAQVGQETLISALLLLRSRSDAQEYAIRHMLDSSFLIESGPFEDYVKARVSLREG